MEKSTVLKKFVERLLLNELYFKAENLLCLFDNCFRGLWQICGGLELLMFY